ncbi:MAG: hypothetical protein K6G28_01445 [Acholeplasmatales bacterium]|nr:hypothetical protein [Acholeplasmatales bacterium]
MFGFFVIYFVIVVIIIGFAISSAYSKNKNNKQDNTKSLIKHDDEDTFDVSGDSDTYENKHSQNCRTNHNHALGMFIGHVVGKYMDVNQKNGENIFYIEYIVETNPDRTFTQKVSRDDYGKVKIGDDVNLSPITNKIVFR